MRRLWPPWGGVSTESSYPIYSGTIPGNNCSLHPQPGPPPPNAPPLPPLRPDEVLQQVVYYSTVCSGDTRDFDTGSYKANLASYLSLATSEITLEVTAASVNVDATIRVADDTEEASVVSELQELAPT